MEPLCALSVQNKNQSLDVVLPFFIFVFKFFYKIYQEFLVCFIVGLNLAINEKSEKFWYGLNDKVRGSVVGVVGCGGWEKVCGVSVGKCWGRCGEGVRWVWGRSVGRGEEVVKWVWVSVEGRVCWVWGVWRRGVRWVWGEVSGECGRDVEECVGSPIFFQISPHTSPHLLTS